MTLENKDLTGKMIVSAIEGHRQLGLGFIESIYENALIIELKLLSKLNSSFARNIISEFLDS
jgi:hypothetical protein